MRLIPVLLLFLLAFSCGAPSGDNAPAAEEDTGTFQAARVNGKWTADPSTAEELRGLHYTIENFTLLNKKKFENLKAYEEFALLLRNHVDRINKYNRLGKEAEQELFLRLEPLKKEIEVIGGSSVEQSRISLKKINGIMNGIDSLYIY